MEEYLGHFILIGLGVGYIIVYCFIRNIMDNAKEKEARLERIAERNREKTKVEKAIQKNISMAKCQAFGNSNSDSVILSNNGKISIIHAGFKTAVKKNIEDLVSIKFNMRVSEKNQMRIISIVPTYDKYTFVEKIYLTLIFELNTYEVFYIPEHKNINNADIQEKIKEMERFKLVVENEAAKFKNAKIESNNDIKKEDDEDISKISNALKELQSLKEQEILTEEEFNEKKKVLLEKIK
ncbi:TPA: SHOCT domain-containing protein [Clostridioides difficile]|uniref:SHOCT domain-containing protein n=1 Tax=Clostridioides difficile TaxID=1496 RepID=UPI00016C6723|nr:SHOCT domain-containing protein [Clostridioides difficile]EGT3640554.1 SHOCT domain-containing protein [Clostridioides difficile]EGT4183815.1 SHOCT domain-containing protein [Clostridioides difficile]EGT4214868.1 SHOCT domain-containing protein [Clostridioides difficile]EGT4628525.1 SHOCT domain-containing protein [Clostridioides difficile]EJA6621317.1 SHOCT domain-containing protein [Clostridioides difficile]